MPGKFASLADCIVLADCGDAYNHCLWFMAFGLWLSILLMPIIGQRPKAKNESPIYAKLLLVLQSFRAMYIPPDSSSRTSRSVTLQGLATVAWDHLFPESEAEKAVVLTTR